METAVAQVQFDTCLVSAEPSGASLDGCDAGGRIAPIDARRLICDWLYRTIAPAWRRRAWLASSWDWSTSSVVIVPACRFACESRSVSSAAAVCLCDNSINSRLVRLASSDETTSALT